jgi:hypothetical protein
MTDTTRPEKRCLACGAGTDAAPLLKLDYRNASYWICPQHLPILIHDPGRLIGKLPGAEALSPAEHHD